MKKFYAWLYRQPRHIIYRLIFIFCLLFWLIIYFILKWSIVTSIQGDKGCIIIEDSANIVAKFKLLMNDSATEEVYELNEGKHRMYHEFVAFCDIIDNQKQAEVDKLMAVSLETMKIQTQARKTVDVIFPADVSASKK